MRVDRWELIEDGDKYWTLLPLYNDWNNKTCFMSVGNTNVPEWDKLVEYCKDNKKETAHFYLDLIKAYEQACKEKTVGSTFVGFFNEIIKICFGNDEKFPQFQTKDDEFIPGGIVQMMYQKYVEWYLDGKPEDTWEDRILM